MFCEKCGTQINSDSTFCPECGAAVNTGATKPPLPGGNYTAPAGNSINSGNPSTHRKRNIILMCIPLFLIVAFAGAYLILAAAAGTYEISAIYDHFKTPATSAAEKDTEETTEPDDGSPTALTVGGKKISIVDYQYYYILMYNYTSNQSQQYEQQYGQNVMGFDCKVSPAEQDYPQLTEEGKTITWAEYLGNTAVERAQQYEVLYREALALDKTKYSLTDEETTTLNDQIESIRSTAAKQNMSINEYLQEFYGEGINEKFLRAQLEKETIVSRFSEDKLAGFKNAWTDDKVKAEYNLYKAAYDVVSLRVFVMADASIANAMLARITDEASFLSLASAYSPAGYDSDSETANFYKSKSTVESSVSADAATWAFAYGRVAGDKSVFRTDTGGMCVVWVKTPPFPPVTVDVRHILISFKADPQSQAAATTEEIAAAKLKAEGIYTQWQSGARTEDSFAALATENSTDTGSAEKGGLYEDVAPGSMVAPFENWCFDPGKKLGDTGIVRSTYGYHIMYMVNNDAANFAYIATIRDDKAAADNETYVTALLADAKYTLTKNEKNITMAKETSLLLIDKMIALNNAS